MPISQLPNIIQKCFCTPDRPMDPTFQMRYVLKTFSMFVAREFKQKLRLTFWRHPVLNISDKSDKFKKLK